MTDNNPKILISGAYGTKNLGDTKILEGLYSICEKHYKNPTVIASSIRPSDTLDRTSIDDTVPTIERDPINWIKVVRDVDIIILGGGTTINHPTFTLRHSLITLISYHMDVNIYVTAGATNGSGIIKKLSYHYLSLVDAVTVRDHRSKNILYTIGVSDPVDVVPDPGLIYTGSDKIGRRNISGRYIIISVSPTDKPIDLDGIAAGLDLINKRTDHKIIFLPFHAIKDIDKKLSEKIIDRMETPASVYSEAYSVAQAEKIIENAEAVVGMRLHSIILAAHMRTPFTAISYNPKCESFLQQINVDQYFNYTEINKNELLNSVMENLERSKPIPESIDKIKLLEAGAPSIISQCESQSRNSNISSYFLLMLYSTVAIIQYSLNNR